MQLPRQVGRYRVTGLLGRGGMGVVLRGRDDTLDRDVAIKLMTGVVDATATGRFHREARMSAKLQHPNIVTIFELGEHEGQSFIAMELLAGTDLRTAISRGLPRTPAVAGPILLQVLAGLGHAHEHGVVHRDVKASNVFLPRGRPAKILDFGVARSSTSASMTSGLVGTPDCMAPEQLEHGHADARSDIYMAGLLLYELLSGEKAFSSESLAGLLYKIVHEGPDLSRLPVGPGTRPLVPIIARAVARDPGGRYPDTGSMAADIQRALGGIDPTTVVAAPGPDATAEPVGESDEWEPAPAATTPKPAAPVARAPQPEPARSPAAMPAPRARTAAAASGGLPLAWLALAGVVALGISSGIAWFVWSELQRRATGTAAGTSGPTGRPSRSQTAPTAGAKAGAPARPDSTAPERERASVAPTAKPLRPPATPAPAARAPATPAPAAATRSAPPPAAGSLERLLDRANQHLESRRYASALQDARTALRADPANAEARAIVEEAELALTVEEHVRRGKQALRAGDKAAAAAEARAGLALAPQDSRLKSLLKDATRER